MCQNFTHLDHLDHGSAVNLATFYVVLPWRKQAPLQERPKSLGFAPSRASHHANRHQLDRQVVPPGAIPGRKHLWKRPFYGRFMAFLCSFHVMFVRYFLDGSLMNIDDP